MENYSQTYDYIFAGGGMAGLSLAYYCNKNPFFKDKTFLIIDQDKKEKNDRTFCFWQSETSDFEPILTQKWDKIVFYGNDQIAKKYDLKPYQYKMLKGEHFYQFIKQNLSINRNIHFLQDKIKSIDEHNSTVITEKNTFFAKEYIFDSAFRPSFDLVQNNNLYQHFLGWTITTDLPTFDTECPTLFDFRIDQHDECRFVYVLPETDKKALVEFTIFSDNLLEQAQYESFLLNYIQKNITKDNFKISEVEYGVIPMSDEKVKQKPHSKIVKIGTAGGFVKASTGYSFERTQAILQQMALDISSQKHPLNNLKSSSWKAYLDTVLLHVMLHKRLPQDAIFTALFHKNGAANLFKFLKGDTHLWEDIKIMNSVPKIPFIKSALSQLGKLFT